MPIHALMLAASIVATPAQVQPEAEQTTYRLVIVVGKPAEELRRYADNQPVVVGESKDGSGVVFVLDADGTGVERLFVDDPGSGLSFTAASRCVERTRTIWLSTERGYVNSGDVCNPEPVTSKDDSKFAGEDAPLLVITRYPLSNLTTRYLLDQGVGGDDLYATDQRGNLITLALNPSIAWQGWIHRACVAVQSSQVKCYKNPDNTKLCHRDTHYIYNHNSECPHSNHRWVKQSGTKGCKCS